MQRPTSPLDRRKTFVFLGNVALFALSSGIAGMFVGALVGIANYFSGPTYLPDGRGAFRRTEWWEVVQFCTVANGIWMSILGVLVGLITFLCVSRANGSWSPQHKERFFQKTKMRLFLPLALSIFVVSTLAMGFWCLWYGGITSPLSDLGSAIEYTGIVMLPVGACLWTSLLARASSRHLSEQPVPISRLLPLD